MKIAILLPDLKGGGAERVSLTLAKEFCDIGHEVVFILMSEEGSLLDQARCRFSIYTLSTKRVREVPSRLTSILETVRADVLIANLWPLTAAAAISVRRIPRSLRPFLALVEHCNLSIQYACWSLRTRLALRASLALTLRLANCRIAVSQGVALDVAKLAWMSVRNFDVVYNPIATDMPSANALLRAETVWGPRTGRRVLSVGTLKREKNYARLIVAFSQMRKLGDKLLILGEGPLRSELKAVARVNGVVDDVLLPGFDLNPSAFYATADLFVLSSDYEGFGNVIVEALAAGLPVVATDCPSGPAEILNRSGLGRLVPVGDEVAMAAAMTEMLASPGGSADRRARSVDFEPKRIAAAYIAKFSLAQDRRAEIDKSVC